MTQEERQEYNKKCAKLLNWKKLNKDSGMLNWELLYRSTERGYVSILNMQFHNNWNWIMEVINQIHAEGFRRYTECHEESCKCVFTDMAICHQTHRFGGGNIVADSGKASKEKEAVVQAINNFLIWYNK